MPLKTMSFMAACRDYFGLQPAGVPPGRESAQTSMQFAQEIKALTGEDRLDLAKGLSLVGYDIQALPNGSA